MHAGQSGVMALWDKLFNMLGVGCAQLLVSPADWTDPATASNVRVCVEAVLQMGAVPILNENCTATLANEVRHTHACAPCLHTAALGVWDARSCHRSGATSSIHAHA
jgi:hypothetical protein